MLSEKPNAFLESKKSKDEDKKEKIPTESKRKRIENPELQKALEGFIDMRRPIEKPFCKNHTVLVL